LTALLDRLISTRGTIDRVSYAVIGFAAFGIKFNLDRWLIAPRFGYHWSLFDYWSPIGTDARLTALGFKDYAFLLTLVAASLPFLWVGVATTIKRLRAMRMPEWIVVLFFIPAVNVVLFALLCALPEVRDQPASDSGHGIHDWFGRFIPTDRFGAIILSIITAGLLGFGAMQLGTRVFAEYGWGVFVGVPFLQGTFAALFVGYHRRATLDVCILASIASVLISALLMFVLAAEGAICILMALPLALILGLLGALLGYQLQRTGPARANAAASILLILMLAPLIIAASAADPQSAPLLSVTTSVDIDATPELVWSNVVSFPPLPDPTEVYFKAGIAFPRSAQIVGRGVGAIRYCRFSTGAFVEPITVWDEPRVLAFNVIQNPPAMKELSPYENLTTPHLRGFLEAAKGEFTIVPVGRHRTRLVGTTWYTDRLWPQAYWELWSDPIIHAIHARVLDHIKALSEESSRRTNPSSR
jgi:uncharacterized membrane protein YhaH (DUF805 family)